MYSLEFRCPRCKGQLTEYLPFRCETCQSIFDTKDSIIDFRTSRKDYYFNPISKDKMNNLIINMKADSWDEIIRSFLADVDNAVSGLDNLIVDGRYAWKVLLNLNPDSVVLDLGCGLGNLSHNIAPHVAKLYAMDLTWQRLEFCNKRFDKFNSNDDIILIAGGDGKYLPFPDNVIDCVILSGLLEWVANFDGPWTQDGSKLSRLIKMIFSCFGKYNPRTIQVDFLKEIKRILKPDGQIFIAIENRLNYQYFTGRPDYQSMLKYSSFFPHFFSNLYSIYYNRKPYRTYRYTILGYKKLIGKAGFDRVDFFGLYPGYSFLKQIFPLDTNAPFWFPESPSNVKEKIKRNKFFVPAYGIVGYASSESRKRMLDELLFQISQSLSVRFNNDVITIKDYIVTDKDKGVITGSIGDKNIIIKLPFNEQGIFQEKQNAQFLKTGKSSFTELSSVCPESLVYGKVNNFEYFVEECVKGEQLNNVLIKEGRTACLDAIENVLNKMNPQLIKENKIPFINSFYNREVDQRLEKLLRVISDRKVKELSQYFHDTLYGIEIYTGLAHNDFSFDNIFCKNAIVSGVIDWGGFSLNGIPIFDSLNYLECVHRLFNPGNTLSQNIHLLAHGRWPVPEEREFILCQYERYGIERPCQKPVVYLFWLYGVTTHLSYRLLYDGPGIKERIEKVVYDIF